MIKLVLALYLSLFPRCELMVSWLTDFSHCNDSSADADHCYATSAWDYGGASVNTLDDDSTLAWFVFRLPFVRSVSCWAPK
jgi:hypothetical protein